MEQIAQGAEAKLYRDGDAVIKDRFTKAYRHPVLDKTLRESRTKREAVIIKKLTGIAPDLIHEQKSQLRMRFIEGTLVKDALDANPALARQVGNLLAKLHEKNIIHADLTTSNMILKPDGTITLIDFGLSFISHRLEDRAVDIHLFRQAIESKHVHVWTDAYTQFLNGYKEASPDAPSVLDRLKIVETRGRNKQSY